MADLSDLRRQLERKAVEASRRTAAEWEARLRRESPSDSGNMRARTTVRSRPTSSGATIEARVDTDYAHIVSSGQRPHRIAPRNPGGVLVFRQGGVLRFARSVNHPGAQPRTWWTDALRDVPDMLAKNWRGVR
jgi:hypothetical protein